MTQGLVKEAMPFQRISIVQGYLFRSILSSMQQLPFQNWCFQTHPGVIDNDLCYVH